MLIECVSVLAKNLQPEQCWSATGDDGNYQSNETADEREIAQLQKKMQYLHSRIV